MTLRNAPVFFLLVGLVGLSLADPCLADWETHQIEQLNGKAPRIKSKAEIQIVFSEEEDWRKKELGKVHYPYMVYMPEKDRLLMLVNWEKPRVNAGICTSDNGGRTWTKPKSLVDSWAVGLTYLGGGNAILLSQKSITGPSDKYWFSRDYGKSWPESEAAPGTNGKPFYEDSQFLVDKDSKTGRVTRLWATGKAPGQACLVRYSDDMGRTWSPCRHIPQWGRTGEIILHRADNGTLIAACRVNLPQFEGKIDHFSGLGVSVSKDNGQTWSELNILYAWGRHMSSMVTLENGHIVLTYVVRKGYLDTADGYPQYGIEAVVSYDNGETWDLDHRYLLAVWKSSRKNKSSGRASAQRTATVLLPDGSLLTAFGAWYVNVGLVHWRVHEQELSADTTISDAPFDSAVRNVVAPRISRFAEQVYFP